MVRAMQNNSSVSIDVIIPAYNASKYIAETIESVLAQTLLPNKIIVVDDGSTDDTVEVVEKFYFDLIEVISIPNGGVSHARNVGIHASNADYIAFLDADDLWEPEKLSAQAQALELHPHKKAVYSYSIMVNEFGAVSKNAPGYKNIPYPPGGIPEKLLFEFVNISGSASSVMVEANTLKSTELFDEKMNFAEDIDLWFRLSLLTDYICVEKNHVKIRINTSSSTRSLSWKKNKKLIADHFYFMNKYADDYIFPRETFGISSFYLVRPFLKNPIRFFEFFKFTKELQKLSPNYYKQMLVGYSPSKVIFCTFYSLLILAYKRIAFIDRLKLLFSEGTIYFSKSKKFVRKER